MVFQTSPLFAHTVKVGGRRQSLSGNRMCIDCPGIDSGCLPHNRLVAILLADSLSSFLETGFTKNQAN